MDITMNFTLGLTQGISWPWPIAVYLFLAGISGGAVAVAIMLNLYKKQTAQNTPILKAASLIGAVTIILGMVCLVADLTNPLWFWRILVYYNLTSVMSLGVIALIVYIPLVCILTLVAVRDSFKIGFLDGLIGWFDNHRCGLQWITLVFALTICAYTGFLISALIRFPLINQAVLPALFVASGLSAGSLWRCLPAMLLLSTPLRPSARAPGPRCSGLVSSVSALSSRWCSARPRVRVRST